MSRGFVVIIAVIQAQFLQTDSVCHPITTSRFMEYRMSIVGPLYIHFLVL